MPRHRPAIRFATSYFTGLDTFRNWGHKLSSAAVNWLKLSRQSIKPQHRLPTVYTVRTAYIRHRPQMCQMRGFRFSINCQPFNLQALFEHLSRSSRRSNIIGWGIFQYWVLVGPFGGGYEGMQVPNKLTSRRERK